jgi:hypothetical protein
MATLVSRLTSTGTLLTNSLFDEVTQPTIKNFAISSQDFNNAIGWNPVSGQVVVTANAIAAPNGTLTADLLLNSAPLGRHTINTDPMAVSERVANYTWSVYVKAYPSSTTTAYLTLYFATGYQQADRIGINVNPSTGVINTTVFTGSGTASAVSGTGLYITSSSQSVGNGWYRVSVTGNINNPTLAGAGNLTGSIGITPITTNSSLVNPSYVGDGTTGFYVWGAQFELGNLTNYQGLSSTGTIVTQDYGSRLTTSAYQATEFDEVTINGGGVAMRQTNTGTILVSGIFDEVTGL